MEKWELNKLMEVCKEKDGMLLSKTNVVKKIYDMYQNNINNYHLVGQIGSGKSWVIDNLIIPFYKSHGYIVIKINVSDFDFVDSEKWIELIYRIQCEIFIKHNKKEKTVDFFKKFATVTGYVGCLWLKKKYGIDIIENFKIIKKIIKRKGKVNIPQPQSMLMDKFTNWVKEELLKNKKILLILDELDRTNPDFATNIIEISKNLTIDSNNFYSIISYDKNIINSFLNNHYHIPYPEQYLKKYNDNKIISITYLKTVTDNGFNDINFPWFYNSISKNRMIFNPREVKIKFKMNWNDIEEIFKKIEILHRNHPCNFEWIRFFEYQLAIHIWLSFSQEPKNNKKSKFIISSNSAHIVDDRIKEIFHNYFRIVMSWNKIVLEKGKDILSQSEKAKFCFFTKYFSEKYSFPLPYEKKIKYAETDLGWWDIDEFLSDKVDEIIRNFHSFIQDPKLHAFMKDPEFVELSKKIIK